ncbi:MAG: sugar phosphate isomerase/epimerase [Bacilli bacterium]|nr:sugar phosphate isomerase/epimerase [Bacilli bacterium]
MKLGVITDCFKRNLEESIKLAASLGLDGVQIYATTGEFSPQTLTENKKEFYKELLNNNNLVVSALCGDMGGHGFENEKDNIERIEKTKRIIDLAKEFNTKVITTHIGVIPSSKNEPRYQIMLKAITKCGIYAKERGITLAIETGPEKASVLLQFLKDTKGGVGVNLDPANFVMVTDQDPVEAVYLLKDYIVHTHLKDGILLHKVDPKIIYDYFAEGGIEALNVSDYFIETAVGKGNVDFAKYVKALKEINYNGFLTIERETGSNPLKDIKQAISYITPIIQ